MALCDDWRCPAKASCALHLWRSPEYGACDLARTVETKAGSREAGAEACAAYRADDPKPWLMS